MKAKQLIVLVAVLIILIAAVVTRNFVKPTDVTTEQFSALDINFDSANARRIMISGGEEGSIAELIKANDQWKVANYFNARADEKKVNDLMGGLDGLEGELRGDDASILDDFKMADEEGTHAEFFDAQGNSFYGFYLGPNRPAYDVSFFREQGSNAVYLVNFDFWSALGVFQDPAEVRPEVEYWVKRNLTKFEKDKVSALKIINKETSPETVTMHVVKGPDPLDASRRRWSYVSQSTPFTLDAEKINSFLQAIMNWSANKVLDPEAKDYGLNNPIRVMEVTLDNGKVITLSVSPKDDRINGHYVSVSDEPVIFQLSTYYVDNFKGDDSKFFINNPLGVDPERTESLRVHTPEKSFELKPMDKKWESLTKYLNDVKAVAATRLLFEPADVKKTKSPGKYWIAVKGEGKPERVLDIGDMLDGSPKSYAAKVRGNTQPFALSETVFKKLFENVNRLNEPSA